MEIKASDRLIAKFMGFKIEYLDNIKEEWVYLHPFKHNDRLSKLKFHTSWDWLMPVVERIEKENHVYFDIYREATRVRYQPQETTLWKAMCPDENDKINHVYNAVVLFIEWYNTNNI